MKAVFVCPMTDTLKACAVEVRNDGTLQESPNFHNFNPVGARLLPFVPAYFQAYRDQCKPFKTFIRSDVVKGISRHQTFLIALHDDATDLETQALSDMAAAAGAKEITMEYRAYLLSTEQAYIAITASKRAISITRVDEKDETERVYLPINDADSFSVRGGVSELDPTGQLPIYTFDLPENLSHIGEPVHAQTLALNFLRIF